MNPEDLQDLQVVDSAGTKVGKVGTIFLDNDNGKPEWAAVKTGLLGSHETLVPLVNADADGSELSVPYTKDAIKNAPHWDPATELSTKDEAELFTHYGVSYSGDSVTADANQGQQQPPSGGRQEHSGEAGVVGHDTSGPTTDNAMTRSEEQLHVGTQQVEAGRAKLRKFVVTEQVTQTVPVRSEKATVTREPITEANMPAATDGPAISEEEHEVVLHAEKAVVEKEAVPVERVRLGTETVTEQQEVTESVRKEQIEQTDDTGRPTR
jgi:uncharacterized protein (TIGR02271 family)